MTSFLALYSAAQWAPAWKMLSAADRAKVPQSLFVAVNTGCHRESAGMAYEIQNVTMAGKTAVITYTISVMKSLVGSATISMSYDPSGWGVNLDSSGMAAFSHGSAAADIKAQKAAGQCASS